MKCNFYCIATLLLCLIGTNPLNAQKSDQQKKEETLREKILLVVSSYGKDSGSARPGYEFDELSQAWLVFSKNGYIVDVASPKGGSTEPDEFNKNKKYNAEMLLNKNAMQKIQQTIPTALVNYKTYKAIYIIGGKGAMFDLPFDPSLQDIIYKMYNQQNAVIAAVCHGPAAFVNIRQTDSTYLLTGKSVTGFCNTEEKKFGKKWVAEFPFLLEDKLKARNSKFTNADMMLPHVVVDGRFVTGQNPYSTSLSAEAVVQALGKTPVQRNFYPDEKSMLLIKDCLVNGFDKAAESLRQNQSAYDIELIAVYGYYRLIDEKATASETTTALKIIELATPYMFNEVLQFEMAKGYLRLNDRGKAKQLLQELLQKKASFEKARKLLESLN
jgi:putative intracellular protease/amidase